MKATVKENNGRVVCKLSTLHWANRWAVMEGHKIILECELVTMEKFMDMLNSVYGDYRFCDCFETATGESFMHFRDTDFDCDFILKL